MAKCVTDRTTYLRVSDAHAAMLVKGTYHYISKGAYRHHLNRLRRDSEREVVRVSPLSCSTPNKRGHKRGLFDSFRKLFFER